MALNIKNPEAEHLARELARQTGESVTEAIRNALKDRLLRVRGRRAVRSLLEDVQDILERVDAVPTVDQRTDDQILDYDEEGLPR
jgi:antitoxin VapB